MKSLEDIFGVPNPNLCFYRDMMDEVLVVACGQHIYSSLNVDQHIHIHTYHIHIIYISYTSFSGFPLYSHSLVVKFYRSPSAAGARHVVSEVLVGNESLRLDATVRTLFGALAALVKRHLMWAMKDTPGRSIDDKINWEFSWEWY